MVFSGSLAQNFSMDRKEADLIMRSNGWLSSQNPEFQNEVLKRSLLVSFEPGEYVYRMGDSLGGIYGLVRGNLTINTSPPGQTPKLIQTGISGSWTGEGCFLTRQPRRLDLQARLPTWMMHLPLEQMDQMAYTNPRVIAQFAQILMATTEVLVRIVYDLQVQNSARRIASVLQRISGPANGVVALSQEELGEMACATRRQVSIALKLLAEEKIVTVQYAKIIINDQHKLKIFMKDE